MNRLPDEHSAWTTDLNRTGRGHHDWTMLRGLAAYLTDRPPLGHPTTASLEPDAWLTTHLGVRLERNRPVDGRRAIVHYLVGVGARPGQPTMCVTACGLVIPLFEAVRTGRRISCQSHACAIAAYKHERPATVATPSGPCHGGAARKSNRGDATGNSVATRTSRDRLQLVQTAAANRGSRPPRSHVATAAPATAGGTTSPARAGRPSEGEPRVMESVAPVRLKAGPTSHRAER